MSHSLWVAGFRLGIESFQVETTRCTAELRWLQLVSEEGQAVKQVASIG